MDVENDLDVSEVEKKLAGALRPISARREFVQVLGRRIYGLGSSIRRVGASTWKFILLMLAGLLSLGLLVALIGRALWRLFAIPKRGSEQTR